MADKVLDSLVAKILMDAGNFTQGMGEVLASLDRVESRIVDFGTKLSGVSTAIESVAATSAAVLAATVEKLAPLTGAILPVEAALGRAAASVDQMVRGAEGIGTIGASIAGLSEPVAKLNDSLASLRTLPDALKGLGSSLDPLRMAAEGAGKLTDSLTSLTAAGANLGKTVTSVGNLSGAMAQLEEANSRIARSLPAIEGLKSSLAPWKDISTDLTAAGKALKDMGAGLERLSAGTRLLTGATNRIEALISPMIDFKAAVSGLDGLGGHVGKLGDGLGKLTEGAAKLRVTAGRLSAASGPIGAIATEVMRLDGAKPRIDGLVDGFQRIAKNTKSFTDSAASITGIGDALTRLTPLFDQGSKVGDSVTALVAALTGIGGTAKGLTEATKAMEGMVSQVTKVGTADIGAGMTQLDQLGRLTSRLARSAQPIADLKTNIADFVAALSQSGGEAFKGFARSLSNVGDFLMAVQGANLKRLPGVSAALKTFGEDFVKWTSLMSAGEIRDMSTVSSSFQKVGSFLDSARKFTYDPAQMDGIAKAMNTLLTPLGSAAAMQNIGEASKAFGRIGSLLSISTKVDPATLTSVLAPVQTLMTGLGNVPVSNGAMNVGKAVGSLRRQLDQLVLLDPGRLSLITQSITPLMQAVQSVAGLQIGSQSFKALGQLGSALARMSYVNPANLQATAAGLKAAMATINSIPYSPNLARTASVINRLANAASNMAAAGRGGAGKGPGGFGFNFSGNIPPQANSARSAVAGMGGTFDKATLSANALSGSLNVLRLSIAGISAAGLASFASMDDALIRALAHAGDYGQAGRRELAQGALSLSGRSTSNATDMVKALDLLQSSGMSATMAVRALSSAENLAVASGAGLVDTTRRLIDVQSAMGLNAASVEENLSNLTRMTDVLVGTSSRVGSTEAQLMDALTGHLAAAMMDTKTTFEDAVAIMGVFSRMGSQFRGAPGGTAVARVIREINEAVKTNPMQWQQVLGKEVLFDAEGNVKSLVDVITTLQEKMQGVGGQQWQAEMSMLGIKSGVKGTSDLIKVMLESGTGLRDLRNEITMMGNVAQINSDMIRGSLTSQFKIMWNNAVNVSSVIGERLAPALYLVTSAVRSGADWFMKLNPAIQNLIVVGAAATAVIYPLSLAVAALGTAVLSVAMSPVRLLTSAFSSLGKIASFVISGVVQTFNGLGTVLAYIYGTFVKIGELVFDTGISIQKLFSTVIVGALAAAVNVTTALIGAVTTLALLIPAAALLGGPIITIGLGVGQLAVMIGKGLVGAWERFKEASGDALRWSVRQVVNLREQAVSLWDEMKEGLDGFLSSVKSGVAVTAGLFWNFQKNAQATFAWLGKYGEQAFVDLAKAAFKVTELIAGNVWATLTGIGQATLSVLGAAWGSVYNIVGAVFNWVGSQWKFAVHDMGIVFGVFLENLVKNFEKVFKIVSLLVSASINEAGKSWYFGEGKKALEATIAAEKAQAMDLLKGGFTGALSGLEDVPERNFKFDRDMYGLFNSDKTGLKPAMKDSAGLWTQAGKEMAEAFSSSVKQMKPLSAAFAWISESPMWQMLFKQLDASLPPDFVTKIGESFTKMFGGAKEGTGTGDAFGKEGPGYQFKQISLERTMLGGPANENLDFQQLQALRNIDGKLGVLIQQRGLDPTVVRKPVLKD